MNNNGYVDYSGLDGGNLGGSRFAVATSHLESHFTEVKARKLQLDVISLLLNQTDKRGYLQFQHKALMGDFNFGTEKEREKRVEATNFIDLWKALRPDEEGYTFDPMANVMVQERPKPTDKQGRIDVMLLQSAVNPFDIGGASWTPGSITMIGTQAIRGLNPVTFPSDHFGLWSTIVFR